MGYPTDVDLDFEESRWNQAHRAAHGELGHAADMCRQAERLRRKAQRAAHLMERLLLYRKLVYAGYEEHEADVARVERKLDAMRADEALDRAHAAVALQRLGDDHRRVEFAVVAQRDATEYWPTTREVCDFLADVFGWDEEHVANALTAAINEPSQAIVGVFLSDGHHIAEDMGFPLPEGADPAEYRLYVSAEAQRNHRINETYAAWRFEPMLLDSEEETQ